MVSESRSSAALYSYWSRIFRRRRDFVAAPGFRSAGGRIQRRVAFHACCFLVVCGSLLGGKNGAAATTSTWTNATSGSWHTASRWSPAIVPRNGSPSTGDTYNVVIDAQGAANYTVDTTSAVTVDSVLVNSPRATFAIRNGQFTASGGIRVDSGHLQLGHIDNGSPSIVNTHVIVAPGATFTGEGGFSGSTLTGEWTLSTDDDLFLTGGFTLDDGVLRGSPRIRLAGTQTIAGNGRILIGSTGYMNLFPGAHVTLEEGIVVTGTFGGAFEGRGGTVLNYGTIESMRDRFHFKSSADSELINYGVIRANPNSTMFVEFNENFRNFGRLVVDGGILALDGGFDQQSIGPIERNSGRVAITGSLVNRGKTLTLDTTTGDWEMSGYGQVDGGRIVGNDGARLLTSMSVESSTGSRFEITGNPIFDIDIAALEPNQFMAEITGGIRVNRTWRMEGGQQLRFVDDQVLGGIGEIVFAQNDRNSIRVGEQKQLTIAPGITVRTGGGSGYIGEAPIARGVRLFGTLSAQGTGQFIHVRDDNFLNAGNVEAIDGGELRFDNGSIGVPTGSIPTGGTWRVESGSRIRIEGAFAAHAQDEFQFLLTRSSTTALFDVGGAATWTGNVSVELASGYIPSPGSRYRLFSSQTRSGAFGAVSLPDLPRQFAWNTSALATSGELSVDGPAAVALAISNFSEPAQGTGTYNPPAGALELGFSTTPTSTGGQNPLAGVSNVSQLGSPALLHRSISATTTFAVVDISDYFAAKASMTLLIANTGYEAGDSLRLYITNGIEQIDLFTGQGTAEASDPLETVAVLGVRSLTVDIPANWQSARLVMVSSSNSTQAAEFYAVDQVRFTGYAVPEPTSTALLMILAACVTFAYGVRWRK